LADASLFYVPDNVPNSWCRWIQKTIANRCRPLSAIEQRLILDLRQNGGGQPAVVTLIASYLFDNRRT
jgi:hypothetical protein